MLGKGSRTRKGQTMRFSSSTSGLLLADAVGEALSDLRYLTQIPATVSLATVQVPGAAHERRAHP